MDPATLLIICFVAARFLVNGYQDGKLAAQGKEPPRWERAKARAAARADGTRRSWWDPIGGYLHGLWSDAFQHQSKKHAVKHGDRFKRWEQRRRRKQRETAKRKRAKTGAAPQPSKSDSAPQKPGGATGTGPTGKPSPTIQGDDVSNPPVIPTGEVNNLPTAQMAMSGWRKFCNAAKAMIERSKASVDTWQPVFVQARATIEQSAAVFTTHKVPKSAHENLARAKEQVNSAADHFTRISTEFSAAGENLAGALANFQSIVSALRPLTGIREQAHAADAKETTAEFINTGG